MTSVAGFTAAPRQGPAPLTVSFTDTSSSGVDGWSWTFGEGGTSAAQHPVYTYTQAGVFTVTLTVTDTETGEGDTAVEPEAIHAVGPTVITYTYDPLQRLTGAEYSTGERFAYAYDAVGNRTAMTETAPLAGTTVTTYTYDAANRLLVSSSPGHLVTYGWDARGNLVSDGVFTYTYNAAGRMVRAESVTLTLVYTYNVNGLRVAQSVDGDVTEFAWDWASGIPEMLVAIGSTNPDTLSQNVLPSCGVYVEGSTCDEVSGYLANGRWNPYGSDASGMPYCPLGRDPDGLPEALANTVGFYVATDGQGHRTVQVPPAAFEWVEGDYRDSVKGPWGSGL